MNSIAQLFQGLSQHSEIIVFVIALLVVVWLAIKSFYTVSQQKIAMIERFGKFSRSATPGLNIKIPFIEQVKGEASLRIKQLNVSVDTKTKDNVFVKVVVSVQYQVLQDKIYDAFYKLTDADEQIQSYVFDVVRAQVPSMTIDTVFENKDSVANAVKTELSEVMTDFGYSIVKALVTDINPDEKVKSAMNEINEQQRLRMAAQEKGEAEKVLKIKRAEAEAESMRLNGEGIAAQRKAIIAGLKEGVDNLKQSIPEVDAKFVLDTVLTTQYYDTLKEMGANGKSTTILLPPQGQQNQIGNSQFLNDLLAANAASSGQAESNT